MKCSLRRGGKHAVGKLRKTVIIKITEEDRKENNFAAFCERVESKFEERD